MIGGTIMELKLFSTQIEPDLHKKLRILSINYNKTVIELVDEAMRDLIKKYEDED